MLISSALCYAQEAQQRERAEQAVLGNVRTVAEGAAAAWKLEGLAAERRERRALRVRTFADDAPAGEADGLEPSQASENPDRGLADR